MATYTLQDSCRFRTHGTFNSHGDVDRCEPYQILILEREEEGVSTFEVWVWCALTACPHWFNLDTTHKTLAEARESARSTWLCWAWRGDGEPVASDPIFVDPRCGEALNPQLIPIWAIGPLHVDADPKWIDASLGEDFTARVAEWRKERKRPPYSAAQ